MLSLTCNRVTSVTVQRFRWYDETEIHARINIFGYGFHDIVSVIAISDLSIFL